MSATNEPGRKSDFTAAEEIKGILQGRDKAEQERIIRWASESLGLAVTPGGSVSHGPPQPPQTEHARHDGVARPKDIKSFFLEKQPKSDNQFVAVVAYFYRFLTPETERKDSITSVDLQDAARLCRGAGLRQPSNALNMAVRQGYLDRAGRGAYKINAVGENLVAMTLPGGGGEANGQRPAKRKRRRLLKKKQAKKPKAS